MDDTVFLLVRSDDDEFIPADFVFVEDAFAAREDAEAEIDHIMAVAEKRARDGTNRERLVQRRQFSIWEMTVRRTRIAQDE